MSYKFVGAFSPKEIAEITAWDTPMLATSISLPRTELYKPEAYVEEWAAPPSDPPHVIRRPRAPYKKYT